VQKKGAFEIYLPPTLHPDKTMSDIAQIAYTDSLHHRFLMVLRDVTPDLEADSIFITHGRYHTYACAAIEKALLKLDKDDTDSLIIGGNMIYTTAIEGKFGDIEVDYRVTTMLTEYYFYQILTWHLADQPEMEKQLYDAMLSFRPFR
jgi:dihydrofolate reductase